VRYGVQIERRKPTFVSAAAEAAQRCRPFAALSSAHLIPSAYCRKMLQHCHTFHFIVQGAFRRFVTFNLPVCHFQIAICHVTESPTA
jgi:hypothetical protein